MKLKYGESLSNLAVKFNLRRYVEGSPALHVAVSAGTLPHFADVAADCVAVLLENSADVFATDDYGKSALHLAAGAGLTKVGILEPDASSGPQLATLSCKERSPVPGSQLSRLMLSW